MMYKMRPLVLITAVMFVYEVLVSQVYAKKFTRLQTDSVSKTRCDLVCKEAKSEARAQCRNMCRTGENKPGSCPATSTEDITQWDQVCVEACNSDSQCEGTEKCCRRLCGAVCNEPTDLLTVPGLPPLPTILDIKENRRSVVLKWSNGVGDLARNVPGKILYIVEQQHHLGPKYEEQRLGTWRFLLRTNKTKGTVRKMLKPGRWYRFRVAAVSSAGTRGFSRPSSPFTPRKGPRSPPPPKNLKVRPLKGAVNGTMTVRLEWKEPKSDLPVMRYKVFWSRRVQGLNGELDSVLVNHQTLPQNEHFIDINNLQPNSMYFFQVQSISRYGNGKLRSEKSAIFYNTTSAEPNNIMLPFNYKAMPTPQALSTVPTVPVKELTLKDRPFMLITKEREKPDKVTGLRLLTFVWSSNAIKGKIAWNPTENGNETKYIVSWKTVKCPQNVKEYHHVDLSALTQKTLFEIYELDYECTYLVNVNQSLDGKIEAAEMFLTVPSFEYIEQKINKKPGTRFMDAKNIGT